MSKNTKATVVGPKAVRAWARENEATVRALTVKVVRKGVEDVKPVNLASIFGGPQGTGRGRVSPEVVRAFEQANPGTRYAEKSEAKSITLPTFDKRGRKTGRSKDVPLAVFRELSGQAKGRPSAASIAKAGQALSERSRKA